MEITCVQMDVLISFYIEGDLSKALKSKVEEHLQKCPACRAKYDIIKTLLCDLKESLDDKNETVPAGSRYKLFKDNLSAYVDNELPADESIKIKKYTISSPEARKELEDTYNIRRLMNDSFQKTKGNARHDYSKKILRRLNPDDEYNLAFHPVLKVAAAFVMTVLILSAIIVFSLTL